MQRSTNGKNYNKLPNRTSIRFLASSQGMDFSGYCSMSAKRLSSNAFSSSVNGSSASSQSSPSSLAIVQTTMSHRLSRLMCAESSLVSIAVRRSLTCSFDARTSVSSAVRRLPVRSCDARSSSTVLAVCSTVLLSVPNQNAKPMRITIVMP